MTAASAMSTRPSRRRPGLAVGRSRRGGCRRRPSTGCLVLPVEGARPGSGGIGPLRRGGRLPRPPAAGGGGGAGRRPPWGGGGGGGGGRNGRGGRDRGQAGLARGDRRETRLADRSLHAPGDRGKPRLA